MNTLIALVIAFPLQPFTPPSSPYPCYIPPGPYIVPIAPHGMDNYMWPPCEPYPPPGNTISQQECTFPEGNPDGSWCLYTNPANGKRYLRWGYHAR